MPARQIRTGAIRPEHGFHVNIITTARYCQIKDLHQWVWFVCGPIQSSRNLIDNPISKDGSCTILQIIKGLTHPPTWRLLLLFLLLLILAALTIGRGGCTFLARTLVAITIFVYAIVFVIISVVVLASSLSFAIPLFHSRIIPFSIMASFTTFHSFIAYTGLDFVDEGRVRIFSAVLSYIWGFFLPRIGVLTFLTILPLFQILH